MLIKLYLSETLCQILNFKLLVSIFKENLEKAKIQDFDASKLEIVMIPLSRSTCGSLVEVSVPNLSFYNDAVASSIKAAYREAIGGVARFTLVIGLEL